MRPPAPEPQTQRPCFGGGAAAGVAVAQAALVQALADGKGHRTLSPPETRGTGELVGHTQGPASALGLFLQIYLQAAILTGNPNAINAFFIFKNYIFIS